MSDYHFQRGSENGEGQDRFFRISAQNFPALKALSLQDLRMEPGDVRPAHVHPNAYQMDYMLEGSGRVGIVGPGGARHVLDLAEGDAAFILRGYLHWIENSGDRAARVLLVVSHEAPETIELADMAAGTPEHAAGRSS